MIWKNNSLYKDRHSDNPIGKINILNTDKNAPVLATVWGKAARRFVDHPNNKEAAKEWVENNA